MLSITKLLQTTKALVNLRFAASIHTSSQVNENVRIPRKTVEEKLGLPQRPKKPLTPYFRYLMTTRPAIMKENPNFKSVEAVQLCAQKWAEVDEATKKKLTDEYQKEKITYVKKRADYENSLTTEQKDSLKIVKQDIIESKEKRIYRKKIKDMERPKKPASGFLRFLSKEFKNFEAGRDNYREFQAKVAQDWKVLPDEKKQAYNDEGKQESVLYKQELAKWELKMIRLGHTDLVRNETLIDGMEKSKRVRGKVANKKETEKKNKADSSDSD